LVEHFESLQQLEVLAGRSTSAYKQGLLYLYIDQDVEGRWERWGRMGYDRDDWTQELA